MQALQWQQEQMRRAMAARTHLLRTIDCLQEAIMLLDTSSTNWHMMYANDAFREACGMPELLVETEAGGSSAERQPGDAGSSLDFWQLFGHVTAGTHGSYNVSSNAAQLGLPVLRALLVLQRFAAPHIHGVA